jgi:hypothetical protein
MSNRRIVTSLVLAVLAAPALVFAQATPIVTLSGAVARGPLSADVFNQRLNASVPAVRACYATALSRAPTLAGVLSLEVSFDAAGAATRVGAATNGIASTVTDAALIACVNGVLGGLSVPAGAASTANSVVVFSH